MEYVFRGQDQGGKTNFSYLHLSPAGAVCRPPVDTTPYDTSDLTQGLIRVLDEDGKAVGPWTPQVEPARLRKGLRVMMKTRIFDARMLIAQRQRKLSASSRGLHACVPRARVSSRHCEVNCENSDS